MNLAASVGTACQSTRARSDVGPAPEATSDPRPKRRRTRDCQVVEFAMRFAVWAAQLRSFPTPEQVRERFGVSRATAYRYRNYYGAVIGVTPPRSEPPGPGISPYKARRRNP